MLWCAIPLQYLEANWHHTRPLVQDQGSFSWYRFLCLDVCSQTQWGWKCLHRKMSLYFPEYCPWMNFPLSGEQWHLSLLPVKHRNNRPILNIRCRHGLRFQLQGYQIIHRITLPALLPPCSFRVHNAAWSLSEVFPPVNEHKKREQAEYISPSNSDTNVSLTVSIMDTPRHVSIQINLRVLAVTFLKSSSPHLHVGFKSELLGEASQLRIFHGVQIHVGAIVHSFLWGGLSTYTLQLCCVLWAVAALDG